MCVGWIFSYFGLCKVAYGDGFWCRFRVLLTLEAFGECSTFRVYVCMGGIGMIPVAVCM